MKRTYPVRLALILVIVAILYGLGTQCQAQNYDSLHQRILKLEQKQSAVDLKLQKYHKDYRIGTAVVIAGLVTTAAGGIWYDRQLHQNNPVGDVGKASLSGVYLGLSITTVGALIQIYSHRHLRKKKK